MKYPFQYIPDTAEYSYDRIKEDQRQEYARKAMIRYQEQRERNEATAQRVLNGEL